jgi:hypothetical protein
MCVITHGAPCVTQSIKPSLELRPLPHTPSTMVEVLPGHPARLIVRIHWLGLGQLHDFRLPHTRASRVTGSSPPRRHTSPWALLAAAILQHDQELVHAQDLQTPVGTTGFGSLLCHLSNGRKLVKCKQRHGANKQRSNYLMEHCEQLMQCATSELAAQASFAYRSWGVPAPCCKREEMGRERSCGVGCRRHDWLDVFPELRAFG